MSINFDKIIDRTNRGARKIDYPILCGEPKDTIQMWIADMDFETAPCIKDALKELVDYGVFGYTDFDNKYFDIVISWFKKRYNYELKSEEIVRTPGVIFALAMVVKAFSEENDSVLIFNPEYVAFREVTALNNRHIVESNLKLENNRYYIDFEDLEKKIKENDVKILMFCSPFNPCGRVWTKDELIKVAKICVENNVIIVSDEIHMDFVWGDNRHIIFLDALKEDRDLYEKASKYTIINTSASKTFNLAGLQVANTIIKDKYLREKVEAEIGKTGYHRISQAAQVALMAAYTDEGFKWASELKKYIYDNILFVKEYINNNIPKIEVIDTEGTYLMWLDFRKYGLDDAELQKKLIYEAKVHLDNGLKFGSKGIGFMRMNVATSRENVKEALNRIMKIFK